MSGPQNINPRPLAMGSLEAMQAAMGPVGWDFFENQFGPAVVAQSFDPGDEVKKFAAAMSQTVEGRRFIDWLLDLTCRAPYPVTSQTIEDLAMSAAKHQARAAVGETIVKAIADGNALLNR